jgi:hypothetical protein
MKPTNPANDFRPEVLPARRAPRATTFLFACAATLMGILAISSAVPACAAEQKFVAAIIKGADGFFDCSKANLSLHVQSTGKSVLRTVSDDLIAADYLGAIHATIVEIGDAGEGEVACAAVAIQDVVDATTTPTATATAAPASSDSAPALLQQHARSVISTRGWKFSTPAPAPAAGPPVKSSSVGTGNGHAMTFTEDVTIPKADGNVSLANGLIIDGTGMANSGAIVWSNENETFTEYSAIGLLHVATGTRIAIDGDITVNGKTVRP